VVIQISPQIEIARVEAAPNPADISGAESVYVPEAGRPEDRTGGGKPVFAEILAGLIQDAETTDAGAVPPDDREVSETDGGEMSAAALVFNENQRIDKTAAEAGTGEAAEQSADSGVTRGAAKTEFSGLDFSEEEHDFPLGMERFFNLAAGQNAPVEESGEEPDMAAVPEGGAAISGGETLAAVSTPDVEDLTGPVPAQPAKTGGAEKAEGVMPPDDAVLSGGIAVEKSRPDAEPLKSAEMAAVTVLAAETETAAGKVKPREAETARPAEGRTRLEEVRSRDKRRGFSIETRDFRAESARKSGELRVLANAETRPGGGPDSREITLELRLPNQGRDAPAADTVWETRSSRAFEDLLARELHQNFNNDIVRHASMALRDGGEGTIRLALKPESLGNVKIRLEMAENKITGHIVVESEEALRAFEREIHSLEQAFKDSGFDAASLQMSLTPDGRDAQQRRQDAETASFPSTLAALRYDAAMERAEPPRSVVDFYERGPMAVNVLA
jgi:hypothetical protein